MNPWPQNVLATVGLRFFIAAILATPMAAQTRPFPKISSNVPLVPVRGAAKEGLVRTLQRSVQPFSLAHHECPNNNSPHIQGIFCGSTTNDQLTSDGSCVLNDGSYADFFSFAGMAGQPVTITLTSSAIDSFLLLLRPDGQTVVAYDDDSAGGTNSRIVFTLDTPGNWIIVANSYGPNELGAYSLALQCGSVPPLAACTTSPTTLCLNGGRFRVTMTFLTPQVETGSGQAVTETADTGLMWFFSANNIEAIVKVVNGCSFNQRYWVFMGGLTNVQVAITVVDTQTGDVRSYWNPQGDAFLPIQDTNAFVCS